MKIYTIKHKSTLHDAYHGHVIVANSQSEVRQIAESKSGDEGKDIWKTADVVCHGTYTGVNKRPFILLSDFNAG